MSSAAAHLPATLAGVGGQQGHSPYGSSGASPGAAVAQTAELWLRIDQLHLNYLKAEESTKKIDIRKKLEGE